METSGKNAPDPHDAELSQLDRADRICDAYEQAWLAGKQPDLNAFLQLVPAEERTPLCRELESIRFDYMSRQRGTAMPSSKQMGDYRLIRELGRGGMGIVYEAEQVSLGRHVALKVLPKEVLHQSKYRLRFEREARAAAKLHHSNIVPVFGFGEYDGQFYYVMQIIQGLALNELLDELNRMNFHPGSSSKLPMLDKPRTSQPGGSTAEMARTLVEGTFQQPATHLTATERQYSFSDKRQSDETLIESSHKNVLFADVSSGTTSNGLLSDTSLLADLTGTPTDGAISETQRWSKSKNYWERVAMIGVQVARALQYAHGQGILHRDIKPANLLLDNAGTVWVTDFGLAKLEDDNNLTQTGDVLGTLRYMAPESFKGRGDKLSEIYSLGLTLYELLTLRPAFDQTNKTTLVDQLMNAQVKRLGEINPQIPIDLQTIIHKSIERDPQHRYLSAGALADDLQRFVDDEPIKARKISLPNRLRRWSRRNKGLAMSLGTVAALLLVINIVGPLVTLQMARLNRKLTKSATDLDSARIEAVGKAAENLRLANEAEAARQESVTMLADMQAERGFLAGEEGAYATAALWFSSAAELTPHDPDRQSANRGRARNWLSEAMIPVGLLKLPSGSRPKMAFQPDGPLLLTWNTTAMRIWDWQLEQALPWTESLSGVTDVTWSPRGDQIAIARATSMIELRAVPSGRLVRRLRHPESVSLVAWSPDGQRIAAAGTRVHVWNMIADPIIEHDWPHPRRVNGLRFNQAGDQLTTCCDDGLARLFAVTADSNLSHPLFAPIEHRTGSNAPPVFYDAGRQLVTSSVGRLRWWNVESSEEIERERRPDDNAQNIALTASANGQWIATSKEPGESSILWNAVGDSHLLDCKNAILNLAFDPASTTLCTIGFDTNAKFWPLPPSSMNPLAVTRFDNETATCAFSSDGRFVAIGGNTQAVVWKMPSNDVVQGQIDAWNTGSLQPPMRPRVGFDGKLATQGVWHNGLFGYPNINELKVVKLADGLQAGPTIVLEGFLADSCLCADRSTVAAACIVEESGILTLYDIATGKTIVPSIELPEHPISVASHPQASQVAVLCRGGQLVVIDTNDGHLCFELTHQDWVGLSTRRQKWAHVEYSPDGNTLITLTPTSQVYVRESATGDMKFPLLNPIEKGGPCRDLAISPDSRWIATAVNNVDTVQVWDLATGQRVGSAMPHPNAFWGIFSVEFSPDGGQILTAHSDQRLRLWDWKTGTLTLPPMQHSGELYDGQFTADGRYTLTAVRQGTVSIWDLKTGHLAAAPLKYPQPWSYSKRPSTNVLGMAGSRVIAAGEGYYTLLDVSSLIEERETDNESLQKLAELCADETLQLGRLTKFQDAQWHAHWNDYQNAKPSSLNRILEQAIDSTSRQMVARRAAQFGLLGTLAKTYPEVAELHQHLAKEFTASGDTNSATEHCDLAISLFEQQLAEDPTNATLAEMLAETLMEKHQQGWITPIPTLAHSERGATLTVQNDGSILASGTNADNDTYVLEYDLGDQVVSMIRLELLPHESLPHHASGRYPGNGNAVISEIEIAIVSDTTDQLPVACQYADSDHVLAPHQHYGNLHIQAANLIDGNRMTRWETWPKTTLSHVIDLQFNSSVHCQPGSRLQIRICNTTDQVDSSPGCFRLSFTSGPAYHKDPWIRLAVAYAATGNEQRSFELFVTTFEAAPTIERALNVYEAADQFPTLRGQLSELFPGHPATLMDQLRRHPVDHDPVSREPRQQSIAATEAYLETNPSAELAGMLARDLLAIQPDQWLTLQLTDATSKFGTTLSRQLDHSVFASRKPETNDSYIVTGTTKLTTVAALRLDAVPHASIPDLGPGWGAGNFHLTQFRAFLQHSGEPPIPLEFQLAESDYTRALVDGARTNDGPMATIDGSQDTVWDIWPSVSQQHWLMLILDEPVDVSDSDLIIVQLDFLDSRWPRAKLGNFRLSLTSARSPHLLHQAQRAINKGELNGFTSLGVAYAILGNTDRSVQSFLNALRSANSFSAERNIVESAGKFDHVLEQLRAVIPDHPALLLTLLRRQQVQDPAFTKDVRQHAVQVIEKRLEENPANRLDTPEIWQFLADHWISRQQWPKAAAASRRLLMLTPDMEIHWYCTAAVIAKNGDKRAYDDLCIELLQSQNTINVREIEKTLKACLLMPTAVLPAEFPIAKLQEAMANDQTSAWFRPFGHAAVALAAWRSGDFEDTLTLSKRALDAQPNEKIRCLVLALQAMAQHRLDRIDDARKSLADAETIRDAIMHGIQPDALPDDWYDRLVADLLCSEAGDQINASSPLDK